MKILPLDSIKAVDSKYRFLREIDNSGSIALYRSLSTSGILTPVVVHDGHLVDGFARYGYALQEKIGSVPCSTLPADTPVEKITDIVFHEVNLTENSSFISKARWAVFATGLGLKRSDVCDLYFEAMKLEPHERVLRKIESAMTLPTLVLDFCHEKNFPMKKVLALTRLPVELVKLVFSWSDKLHLTASIIEELCERTWDYLKANGLTVDDLKNNAKVNEILNEDISPHNRSNAIREYVRELRLPALTAISNEMDIIRNDMSLPPGATLSWDKSLELHEIKIELIIKNRADFPVVVKNLANPDIADGITELLAKL